MASQKPAVDAVTFPQLFKTIVAYINHNENNNVEDLQTVDEMSKQLLISYAENGGIAELTAVKEVIYKMLLVVMIDGRPRWYGRSDHSSAGHKNRRSATCHRSSCNRAQLRRSSANNG